MSEYMSMEQETANRGFTKSVGVVTLMYRKTGIWGDGEGRKGIQHESGKLISFRSDSGFDGRDTGAGSGGYFE